MTLLMKLDSVISIILSHDIEQNLIIKYTKNRKDKEKRTQMKSDVSVFNKEK